MGRGRGNSGAGAAAHTKPTGSSSYGHGARSGTASEVQWCSSSSYGYSYRKGFHRVDMAQSCKDSWFDNGGAYSFRPLGSAPWTGDGSRGGGNGGAGHGRSVQPRGW